MCYLDDLVVVEYEDEEVGEGVEVADCLLEVGVGVGGGGEFVGVAIVDDFEIDHIELGNNNIMLSGQTYFLLMAVRGARMFCLSMEL